MQFFRRDKMHASGICLCLFLVVLMGCVVTLTVVYAKNPCCNQPSPETYQHHHDMTIGEKDRMRVAGKIKKYTKSPNPHMQAAAKNAAMWARHGWVDKM